MLNGSAKAKPSLKRGAVVRVRRALRSVCAHFSVISLRLLKVHKAGDRLSNLIGTLLAQSKSSLTPLRFFPLLGVAVDVLLRLKHLDIAPPVRLSDDIKVCPSILIPAPYSQI
jgi:hypothetical protein